MTKVKSEKGVISVFASQNAPNPSASTTIDSFIAGVMSGMYNGLDYREQITKLRSFKKGDKEYSRLKEGLPSFTISCYIQTGSGVANIVSLSNYLLFELDYHYSYKDAANNVIDYTFEELAKQDELYEQYYEQLRSDNHTKFIAHSAGGKGFFVIFQGVTINSLDEYTSAYNALIDYVQSTYTIPEVSESEGKNANRKRQFTFDERCFFNPNNEPFNWLALSDKAKKKPKEQRKTHFYLSLNKDRLVLDKILEKSSGDIFADYHEWFAFVSSICAMPNLSESDKWDYWFRFSGLRAEGTQAHKYAANPEYYKRVFKSHLKWADKHKNGGQYVFFYAKERNIELYDKKETDVLLKISALKSKKKSQKEIAQTLENDFDIRSEDANRMAKEALETDLQIYTGLTPEEQARQWLVNTFDVCKSEFDGEIYVRLKPEGVLERLNESKKNSIKLEYSSYCASIGLNARVFNLLDSLIHNESTPSFCPIKDYFKTLAWNGKSEFDILKNIIEIRFENKISKEHTDTFHYFFKKWLIAAYKSYTQDIPSDLALILQGSQSAGKEYFLHHLIPKPLQSYITNIGSLKTKQDILVEASKRILLIDSEFGTSNLLKINDYKELLGGTLNNSIRLAHAKFSENFVRKGVFCFCTNDNKWAELFRDEPQNRRFIPAVIHTPIHGVRIKEELLSSLDIDNLWAEVATWVANGESGVVKNDYANNLLDIDRLTSYTNDLCEQSDNSIASVFSDYFELYETAEMDKLKKLVKNCSEKEIQDKLMTASKIYEVLGDVVRKDYPNTKVFGKALNGYLELHYGKGNARVERSKNNYYFVKRKEQRLQIYTDENLQTLYPEIYEKKASEMANVGNGASFVLVNRNDDETNIDFAKIETESPF